MSQRLRRVRARCRHLTIMTSLYLHVAVSSISISTLDYCTLRVGGFDFGFGFLRLMSTAWCSVAFDLQFRASVQRISSTDRGWLTISRPPTVDHTYLGTVLLLSSLWTQYSHISSSQIAVRSPTGYQTCSDIDKAVQSRLTMPTLNFCHQTVSYSRFIVPALQHIPLFFQDKRWRRRGRS